MSKNQLNESAISNWYSGKNIFITGASGFMGKVLVEKLLRSCPNLGKIYILIRPKRGQTPQERLSSILEAPLFNLVREKNGKFSEKIETITGDLTLPDLGINSDDKIKLINNISVVFHIAATVKFDEPLKDAVTKNILAVQELIHISYQMKNLKAFTHVSTAYSNCLYKEIEEKLYASPMDIEKLIQCVQCLDIDILNEITPRLIRSRPNTYTFTKELAEHLVMKHKGKLPIAIFRPSIVVGSCKEPFAGWIDNINGPTGIFYAGGKGIVRSGIGREDCIGDVIPVDLAINCLICIAWKVAESKLDNIPIYNYTSGLLNPITWNKFYNYGMKYARKYPHNEIIWYPGGKYMSSPLKHKIKSYIYHFIPAYIIDTILLCLGHKVFMVKTMSKIETSITNFQYFVLRDWEFQSKNVPKLYENLNETDRELFDFDIRKVDWDNFTKNFIIGIKLYIGKDDLITLPKARDNLKKMKILHYGFKSAFYVLLLIFLFYLYYLYV